MKKLALLALISLTTSINGFAQNKKKQDAAAIKKMCGCFEVTFNFAETFNYSEDSLCKPSETKVDKGLEWAQLIEDDKNKISIQHLLQVGPPNSPYIVKHWRQDWLYENTDFYMFNGDNTWNFVTKPKAEVKGQWTQKVYQVDDSPRYEGSGTWVHVDGKNYWENTTKVTARDISTSSAISLVFSAAVPCPAHWRGLIKKKKEKRRRVGKGGIKNW